VLFVGGLDELTEEAIALDDKTLVQGFGGALARPVELLRHRAARRAIHVAGFDVEPEGHLGVGRIVVRIHAHGRAGAQNGAMLPVTNAQLGHELLTLNGRDGTGSR